ncbi:P7E4 protein, partial [Aphelenchoides avenae]
CWNLIDSKTTDVIRSEAFLHLSAPQLSDIVKRNTLCVEEIELYERIIEWAQTQLRKDGVDLSPKAVRDVLGDALFSIRFPAMEQKEFSSKVVKGGVLTAEEALEVLMWHSIHDKPKSFNFESRAHGRIRLKFDARALLDGSLASPHDSAPKQIGDVQWSIIAQRKPVRRDENVYALGFFLKCHGVPTDPQWRRGVHMLMRVVAQAPGADDLRKTAAHTFYSREDDWGFCQFAPFDALLDTNNGFLVENKYVELIVDVFAKDCAPPT